MKAAGRLQRLKVKIASLSAQRKKYQIASQHLDLDLACMWAHVVSGDCVLLAMSPLGHLRYWMVNTRLMC